MAEVDPIAWARERARHLRRFNVSPAVGGDRATPGDYPAAVEFLRSHAGPRSAFTVQAEALAADRRTASGNAHALADILEQWAGFIETGLAGEPPFEMRARQEAATDLMEQVELLLSDRNVHHAAPVVLAGAALEELLRGMVEAANLTVSGKPGIDAYASVLRTNELISKQDKKDIDSWAGKRNLMAHGEFDEVTLEQARLMVDGINLFMRQYRGAP